MINENLGGERKRGGGEPSVFSLLPSMEDLS
jgi:hypothetical protein